MQASEGSILQSIAEGSQPALRQAIAKSTARPGLCLTGYSALTLKEHLPFQHTVSNILSSKHC